MKIKNIIKILGIGLCLLAFNSLIAQSHRHNKTHKHVPHHRYSNMPRWGHRYSVIPGGNKIYEYRGVHYHYHNGVFYKPVGRTYVVVRPPVGIKVRTLPAGYVRFVLDGRIFYYYYGTYYIKSGRDNQYVSVSPPVGAQVDALPEGYRKVIIDNKVYYEFEGTYYKAFMYQDGEVWYEVVGEI